MSQGKNQDQGILNRTFVRRNGECEVQDVRRVGKVRLHRIGEFELGEICVEVKPGDSNHGERKGGSSGGEPYVSLIGPHLARYSLEEASSRSMPYSPFCTRSCAADIFGLFLFAASSVFFTDQI